MGVPQMAAYYKAGAHNKASFRKPRVRAAPLSDSLDESQQLAMQVFADVSYAEAKSTRMTDILAHSHSC